jgi:hypothetical protein
MMSEYGFSFDGAEVVCMRRLGDIENLSEALDLNREAIQAKENAPFGSLEEKKTTNGMWILCF